MADKFVVHKFGGTSVGDASCFARVSDIVAGIDASKVAVVVSAMGGKPKVTDMLISLLMLAKEGKSAACEEVLDAIRQKHRQVLQALLPDDKVHAIANEIEDDLKRLSELLRAISIMRSYNENVVEFISGHGEVWSAKTLTAILNERMARDSRKERFKFVDAREFLVVEPDTEHGPVVQYEQTEARLGRILRDRDGSEHDTTHVVITGFICSTTEGVMTTLKRDGSDFTASICGRVLKARSITIWTDVSGVLSSDPRRVPESKILPEISYEEAMELAYFGAKVIHPKTMTPAVMGCIPIYIRNTFEPSHPGTKIFHRRRLNSDQQQLTLDMLLAQSHASAIVSGFSTVDNLALFNIEGSGMVGVHGTSSRLFNALDRVKVNVVLIAQASSEHSICFAIPMDRAEEVKEIVDETFFKEIHHGLIEKTEFISPISIIAAVGDNMSQTSGVCGRFFGALGRAGINVLAISQGSSERNISAVVRYEDSAAALRAVHSAFFLSDHTISVGIVGLELEEHTSIAPEHQKRAKVGRTLLEQCAQQSAYLKEKFNVDLRIRAIATHSSSQMLLDTSGKGIQSDALYDAQGLPFEDFNHERFLQHICADHLPLWVVVDVSNCSNHVEELYKTWLERGLHVITSNGNVASCSSAFHQDIKTLARAKQRTFDTEACVAIGVPVFRTMQSLLQTGDDIECIEYSGSPFLDALLVAMGQATNESLDDVKEAIDQHLQVQLQTRSAREILDELLGKTCAKKAILIARELGAKTELGMVRFGSAVTQLEQAASDLGLLSDHACDHGVLRRFLHEKSVPVLAARVAQGDATAAGSKGYKKAQLVASVDGRTGAISVALRVSEGSNSHFPLHSLAVGQCGVAFHSKRHAQHPVVITAGVSDCSMTAESLFSSLLSLARNYGARAIDSAV